MNALIDTESKSYREGYTKTECYGYGDLCTYFIDSQAKFDAWVANTAGNNYSHIIIKGGCGSGTSGAYETTTTINLTTTETKTIQGVNNAEIISSANSGITNFMSGDWIRDLSVYMLNGANDDNAFNNCSNLIYCRGFASGTSTGYGYGFYNCSNLTDCTGDCGAYGGGFYECSNLTNCKGVGNGYGVGYGFTTCTNLINCWGHGSGYDTSDGYGFNACNNLTNCTGSGDCNGTGVGVGYGFNACTGVIMCKKIDTLDSTTATFNTTNCCANQGTYSSTYKVANTANGGFNNLR